MGAEDDGEVLSLLPIPQISRAGVDAAHPAPPGLINKPATHFSPWISKAVPGRAAGLLCSVGFGSSQICCEAEGWELLFPRALSILLATSCPAALQRDILGLEGTGSTGVGSLAPGLSPIHSPHPSSLEPSMGMSPGVGDSGWDELGQCLIWVLVGPAHAMCVAHYWDVLGDLQGEWNLLLFLLE